MSNLLQQYVPAHFRHPWRLAQRLLQSRDGAAWQAMAFAALGVAATPLDVALAAVERRLGKTGPKTATQPVVLVCGPPRAGTTVVYQTLIANLPVAYLSNLTAVFPRAPLAATKWTGLARVDAPHDLHSFYGKTRGLRGACDALPIWDRWFGADRTRPTLSLGEAERREMGLFFAAAEEVFQRPLCCKNNSLNVLAQPVAECVPQAIFLCMTREPLKLAASLYRARADINGELTTPYGLSATSVEPTFVEPTDPVESVIEQVRFFARTASMQQERIGPERFWLISYEDFCAAPASLVERVAQRVFGSSDSLREKALSPLLAPPRRELPPEVAQRFATALGK